MFKVAVLRFLRIVGGQTLGYAVTATTLYVASTDFGPEGVLISTVLGALLTATDKYLRGNGVYGEPNTVPIPE